MRCDDVRELLGSFIDDELPVEVVARINGHVAECLKCQDERTDLTMLRSRLHDYTNELDPSWGFMERLKLGVDRRIRANHSAPRLLVSSYLMPIAAVAAAVVLYVFPYHHEQQSSGHIARVCKTTVLTAQQLYSYEHNLQSSRLVPGEYDSSLAVKLTGVAAAPPHFSGWSLTRTRVVSVNSTKAIRYSY